MLLTYSCRTVFTFLRMPYMFQPVFIVFLTSSLSSLPPSVLTRPHPFPHLEGEQMWLANLWLQPVAPHRCGILSGGKGNVPLPVPSTAPPVNRICHQQLKSPPPPQDLYWPYRAAPLLQFSVEYLGTVEREIRPACMEHEQVAFVRVFHCLGILPQWLLKALNTSLRAQPHAQILW